MSGSADGARAAGERVVDLLGRARRLLHRAGATAAVPLADDAALRKEARRLVPHLETLVGRRYGRLPRIGYRRGLEARLAGPWSQYLTLGIGPTRVVRMTSWLPARAAMPTILAHELAHRYAFDESLTTLRGLEVSARLAEQGDAAHQGSVQRELARLAFGAAAAEALRVAAPERIEGFLAELPDDDSTARMRALWRRLRGAAGGAADCVTTIYCALPCVALERAAAAGATCSAPLPFPRFRIDSLQSAVVALYTGADALSGRRRAPAPLDATLRLWRSAG